MHILHISRACRAHLANTHFFVDFFTKNSARMGIDGNNQRFYNMVVNRFTGQATEISLRCTPLP